MCLSLKLDIDCHRVFNMAFSMAFIMAKNGILTSQKWQPFQAFLQHMQSWWNLKVNSDKQKKLTVDILVSSNTLVILFSLLWSNPLKYLSSTHSPTQLFSKLYSPYKREYNLRFKNEASFFVQFSELSFVSTWMKVVTNSLSVTMSWSRFTENLFHSSTSISNQTHTSEFR